MAAQEPARDVLRDVRRGGIVVLAALVVATLVALARTQLRHRPGRSRDEWRRIR
ncbi:MAG: hypothetical protein IT198_15725 [Acidimicrobiia bacterium]|nr:hypothetical protein [Acidimicrobiia bacterium]